MDYFRLLMQEAKEQKNACSIRGILELVRKLKADLLTTPTKLDKLNILLQYNINISF